jgi:hypothetical protein
MRTHRPLIPSDVLEDLEDVGRTGELAENRVNDELTEQLVKGHEDIFYGYEFAVQGGGESFPIMPSSTTSASTTATRTSCAPPSGSIARGAPP